MLQPFEAYVKGSFTGGNLKVNHWSGLDRGKHCGKCCALHAKRLDGQFYLLPRTTSHAEDVPVDVLFAFDPP